MTDVLYESGRSSARFQLRRVLPSSTRARLVVAEDLRHPRQVVLKAPTFRDSDEQKAREQALAVEAQAAAAAPWPLLETGVRPPEGVNTLAPPLPQLCDVSAAVDAPTHACLVMPYVEGERLDRWASTHHANGAPADVVLRIATHVLDALRAMHDAGFVHRRVSPEHVMLCQNDTIQLVGFGGSTIRNAGYPGGAAPYDPAYTAPECRTEVSGRFNVPKADVFSLGLLMAYLATGERPSTNASSPLTRTAATRLLDHDVSLSLLIGKCLQPLQKNRMGLNALRPHLLEQPSETTVGFGPVELVAVWRQEEISALPVGTLSPGPLVNRASAPSEVATEDPREGGEQDSGALAEACQPAAQTEPATPAAKEGKQAERPWLRWIISALVIAVGAYLASRNLR